MTVSWTASLLLLLLPAQLVPPCCWPVGSPVAGPSPASGPVRAEARAVEAAPAPAHHHAVREASRPSPAPVGAPADRGLTQAGSGPACHAAITSAPALRERAGGIDRAASAMPPAFRAADLAHGVRTIRHDPPALLFLLPVSVPILLRL